MIDIIIMVLSLKNYDSAAFKVYSGILIRPILDAKKTLTTKINSHTW